MTIAGSGFQTGSVVSIPITAGAIVGTPFATANSVTLTFAAASGASAIGTWPATVTNPDGNSDSANFTIHQATLALTSVSPSTLVWGSTRNFTLTGTGFNNGARVTLDGLNVNESWVSSTSMTVALTADPSAATHTFTLTNPDGGNASRTFIVTKNPINVTSVSPSVAQSGSTKAFTISGSGFLSGAAVELDDALVTSTRTSSTLMSVTLSGYPSSGSHTFTVINPDGGSDTGTFTVTGGHITGVSPTSIKHGKSATVTITGTGFVTSGFGTATVTVNGSTSGVSSVTISSSSKVTFKYTITSAKGSYALPVQVTSKDGSVSDVFSWVVTSS
jgi:hypothetical protein